MSNALGAIRLSHLTAETMSPADQRNRISGAAGSRGDNLVHITEDLDVSGAVSPFDREDLGPWLTDPDKIRLWDILIVAKLDRITRSLLDFQVLLKWCEAHKKAIVSVSEGFDLSTPIGKMIANILVMFAEFERTRMGERRSERAQADIARGWWGGGRTKYGYVPVKVDNHYELIEDLAERAVAYRMAKDILAGMSASQLARNLTAEGIPTKIGGKWASTTILDILRDPAGIIDTDLWVRLQPVIGAMSRPQNNRYDAAALSGVIFCQRCRGAMWGQRNSRTRNDVTTVWQYYRCHSEECKNKTKMVRAADLESAVDDLVISEYGDNPHTEKLLIPGSDNQRKLNEIDRGLTELAAKLAAKAISREDYRTKQDVLFSEQDRLEALPSEPDKYEDVDTGMTVAEYWAGIDWPAKRRYFTDRGWSVYAVAGARRGDLPVVVIEGGEFTEDARTLGVSVPV